LFFERPMRQLRVLGSIFTLFALMAFTVKVVTDKQWKASQLIKPSEMAAKISENKHTDWSIFNIGPVDQIKGALQVGSASAETGLKKLKELAEKRDRNKKTVIYCGCCSTINCPNLKPAYEQLVQLGYKDIRIIDFQTSLKADWISKGFPMER
jgi:hypothetical protein